MATMKELPPGTVTLADKTPTCGFATGTDTNIQTLHQYGQHVCWPLSNYIYCHWCVAIVQMYGPSVEYQHRNTMYNKPLKVIGMDLP